MARLAVAFFVVLLLNSSKGATQVSLKEKPKIVDKKITLKVLPQNFYNQHLSFFCKKEIEVQKRTALPLFIRLGSKEHVDYLERKPNSFIGKRE
jgi:hypothetical protein